MGAGSTPSVTESSSPSSHGRLVPRRSASRQWLRAMRINQRRGEDSPRKLESPASAFANTSCAKSSASASSRTSERQRESTSLAYARTNHVVAARVSPRSSAAVKSVCSKTERIPPDG